MSAVLCARTLAGAEPLYYEVNDTQRELYRDRYALLIGAGEYEPDTGWARLGRVDHELDRLETELRRQGFEVERLPNPRGNQLYLRIQEFIARRGAPQNALLIVFSGHGWTEARDDDRDWGYIVPVDAPNPEVDLLGFRASAMSMHTLKALAEGSVARHTFFVFDSCFSGAIFNTRSNTARPPSARHDAIGFDQVKERGVQFLTAGDETQRVPSESAFMDAFIAGIQGRADLDHDGYVTAFETWFHLTHNTRLPSQSPQYGNLYDTLTGDFVFKPLGEAPATESEPPTPDPRDANRGSGEIRGRQTLGLPAVMLAAAIPGLLIGGLLFWRDRQRPGFPRVSPAAPKSIRDFWETLREPNSLKLLLGENTPEAGRIYAVLNVFAERAAIGMDEYFAHPPAGTDENDLRAVADTLNQGLMWMINISICRNEPEKAQLSLQALQRLTPRGSAQNLMKLHVILRWFLRRARAPERRAAFKDVGKQLNLPL